MFYIDNEIETTRKFDMIKFMEFNKDNSDPLNSFIISNIKNLPEQGTYTITSSEFRPDMLSFNIYNDTQYWWLLLLYNEINNINEIVVGKVIRYPSLNNLQNLYIQATTLRKTEGNT